MIDDNLNFHSSLPTHFIGIQFLTVSFLDLTSALNARSPTTENTNSKSTRQRRTTLRVNNL